MNNNNSNRSKGLLLVVQNHAVSDGLFSAATLSPRDVPAFSGPSHIPTCPSGMMSPTQQFPLPSSHIQTHPSMVPFSRGLFSTGIPYQLPLSSIVPEKWQPGAWQLCLAMAVVGVAVGAAVGAVLCWASLLHFTKRIWCLTPGRTDPLSMGFPKRGY